MVHKAKVSALFLSFHTEGKTYVISRQLSLEPTIVVKKKKKKKKCKERFIRLADVFTNIETLSSVLYSLVCTVGPRSILDISVHEDTT